VGQDEDPEPLVRRADFCRAEQARRRRVTQAPKVSQDGFEAEGDVAGDVFEEHPFGAALADDASDLRPEVAGIVGTTAFSGRAEGLAGVTCQDDVEGAAEGPDIETAQIVPNRCRGKVPRTLGGDQDGAGVSLPLDEGASVEAWFGQHDAQIKASAACAEGQSVPGT
jgi:hypothetical protein